MLQLGEWEKSREQLLQQQLKEQVALKEATRKNSLMPLMANLLASVEAELAGSPNRSLKGETIDRIADLSHALEPAPFSYVEADSLEKHGYSKERGMLLLELVRMGIDSSSFLQIRRKVSFEKADLSWTKLVDIDLSETKLAGTNFSDAVLRGINFSGADLRGAQLLRVNLEKANLNEGQLNRVNLSWANLNGATLKNVALGGANLSNAQLNRTDMTCSTVYYANAAGARFCDANLYRISFFGTDLTRTNFFRANLDESDLRRTHLADANMEGVTLELTHVYGDDWLRWLNRERVIGGEKIQNEYIIVKDIPLPTNHSIIKIK
ncbi:MAG: pentapeptide repeat-containing protein [Bacteroidota bacterium]